MKARANVMKSLWLNVTGGISHIALPVMIVGLFASLAITLVNLTTLNVIVFALYVLFTIFQLIFQPVTPRPWGRVFDTGTMQPSPLVQVSIVDTENNRVIKSRLTDYQGRYHFLPPEGKYRLEVKKPGYKYPSESRGLKSKEFKSPYFGEGFEISKSKKVINADVPIDRLEQEQKNG